VNSNVGSFFMTMGAEGTIVCPFDWKKSRNFFLISALVIIKQGNLWLLYRPHQLYLWAWLFSGRAKVHQINLFCVLSYQMPDLVCG